MWISFACRFSVAMICSLQLGVPIVLAQAPASSNPLRIQQQTLNETSLQVELREPEEAKACSTFALVGLANVDDLKTLTEDQLQELLTVRVAREKAEIAPPLLGSYSVSNGELQFVSRYPLSRNVKYSVAVSSKLTGRETAPLEFALLSNPSKPPPRVQTVYPTSDVLPENVLKFYIHFTAPMSRGEAYQRIHLFHEGTEVKDPFLELGEELWDVDQTRFTLFIHPGRIKRGVKPREDDGLPMTDGKEYSLQIDAEWFGSDLQPLESQFVKKFRVVAADDQQPNPVNWKIETPKANSRQPVKLTFNEPLDHAMLNRVLQVRSAAGAIIEGSINVAEHETVWSFEPAKPWQRSDYAIEVATNLEDLCGNSIARPFETKMQIEDSPEIAPAPLVAIEFSVE